ncbi:hypothetical protein [Pseudomonas sp. Irchel 3E13]|uniref:hypothetical protein n=1 Tax=Pseudomonas sp. Irchel 3E13 TaxID=2008975 RepID=UPI00135C139E|nr:hypothetical protein [Pseudomonas sp. Irchel 3E13]
MNKTIKQHLAIIFAEFVKAVRQVPAIYFAPIRGAIMGVISQWRKLQANDAGGGTPKAA